MDRQRLLRRVQNFAKLRRVQNFLKAKQSEGKPVEAYQEQLKSVCRREIYEVKRHSKERHPSFYFISFINPHSPLADIVIVHIVYINETIPPPPPLCDAVGGALITLF